MSRPRGGVMDRARLLEDEIIDARKNDQTCKAIAERYDIPEYTVWQIMKDNGLNGEIRATTRSYKRKTPRKLTEIIQAIEEAADEFAVERSADETGWIATIDDLSGDQKETVYQAIKSAFELWREAAQ